MKVCVICKEDTGLLGYKTYNGYLCRKCRTYIPMNIRLKECDTDYLLQFVAQNKERAEKFECTASCGTLFLDSVHGMLCFSNGVKNGEPTGCGDIFFIHEIREMGLYCTDVRNIGSRSPRIICNVKMRIKTDTMNVEYMVLRNEVCPYTIRQGNEIDYREPDKISMLRPMLQQMIDDVLSGLLNKLEDIRKLKEYTTKADLSKEWAKGIFFLTNGDYTMEEVKTRYKTLMRIFHPDMHPDLGDVYAQKLNEAYRILNEREKC